MKNNNFTRIAQGHIDAEGMCPYIIKKDKETKPRAPRSFRFNASLKIDYATKQSVFLLLALSIIKRAQSISKS